MIKKPYFKTPDGSPAPLSVTVKSCVRFEEVDPLNIVWHGRYASYFEDARVVLGETHGIGYMDLYSNGILAPIKTLHVDYISPLRFREEITIKAILHWSEAARINNEFIIKNSQGDVAARGYTVQMMMDTDHQLSMWQPPFYKAFCDRWKAGELS